MMCDLHDFAVADSLAVLSFLLGDVVLVLRVSGKLQPAIVITRQQFTRRLFFAARRCVRHDIL